MSLYWVMLAVTIICVAIFGWSVIISFRRHQSTEGEERLTYEHWMVGSTAALLVGIGNIVTAVGFLTSSLDIVETGSLLVRGSLVVIAIYFVLTIPRTRKDRHD